MAEDNPKNYDTLTLKTMFQGHGPAKGKRNVPMKVLCLGMSRTGTISLRRALLRLGYVGCYHMLEVIQNPEHAAFWIKAAEGKWEGGTPPTREEWESFLGNYQAGADNPFAAFAPELIALYPNAKVILTNKDPDAFWRSWQKTAIYVRNPPLLVRIITALDLFRTGRATQSEMTGKTLQHQFHGDFNNEANVKRTFQEHYDAVRRLVPAERLLEYRIEEGWEPLCHFLGEDVPADPFPKGNSGEDFQNAVALIWKIQTVLVLVKWLAVGGGAWGLVRAVRLFGGWEKVRGETIGLGRSLFGKT